MRFKTVRNDSRIWRRVYYQYSQEIEKTLQIGVLTSHVLEPDTEGPLEYSLIHVHVPIEKERPVTKCQRINQAEKFLFRELSPLGRMVNKFIAAFYNLRYRSHA